VLPDASIAPSAIEAGIMAAGVKAAGLKAVANCGSEGLNCCISTPWPSASGSTGMKFEKFGGSVGREDIVIAGMLREAIPGKEEMAMAGTADSSMGTY
jgi:hypothetical protein